MKYFIFVGLIVIWNLLGLPELARSETVIKPSLTGKINEARVVNTGKKRNKFSTSFYANGDEATIKSEKDLLLVLSGLNSLIAAEKQESKRNELLLSKAASLVSLGKLYYLNGKTSADKLKRDGYLRKAVDTAQPVGQSSTASPTVRARVFHVFGTSYLYQNDEAKAVENFEQAIKLDPKSKLNPRLSLFIAEFYFDHEQFDKALIYYGMFFQKLSTEDKALAIYKSGWCYFINKEYENSETAFLKIIGKSWAIDYSKDALRDLSQAVVAHRSEESIIEFGRANFKNENVEILPEFYTNCYYLLLRQSGNLERTTLYNEIQKLEKKPERRVALAIKKLSSHQKGYASASTYSDIIEIDHLITQGQLKPDTDSFRFFGAELELEITRTISSYLDTISKKVKSPESIPDLELYNRLQRLLWFHIGWYPSSPNIQKSYLISLDNCQNLHEPECSLRTGRLILKEEKLRNVWLRAKTEIIIAEEELGKKNPEIQKNYAIDLKSFVDTERGSKDWLVFAKKYTNLLLSQNKYSDAQIYLTKIYQAEATPENLYRKVNCEFKMNRFDDVVQAAKKGPSTGPYSQEIRTLLRESNLAIAQQASANGNFELYEKNLFEFLSLNPSEEKADLARVDYLNKLLGKKNYEKAMRFLENQPSDKKYLGPLAKGVEQLLVNLMALDRYQDASNILKKDFKLGKDKRYDGYWFRISLALNGKWDDSEKKILSLEDSDTRIGILSLAAVSQPDLVQTYYAQYPPVDLRERKLWILGRQFLEGSKVISLTKEEIKILGNAVTNDIIAAGVSTSERLSKMIEYPQVNWSQERLAKIIPDSMERVKTVRKQLMRDLTKVRPEAQRRLILNALNVEKRLAWFFDNSPAPPGLSPQESEAYKAELSSYAADYHQQIGEYLKLLSAVISIENEQAAQIIPIPADMSKWKRNSKSPLNLVEQELKSGKGLRALLVLESQKMLDLVKDEDYYRTRSFIVLSLFSSDFSSTYIRDELTAVKQIAIIGEWKNLVQMNEAAIQR